MSDQIPAGWYVDPDDVELIRFWDGQDWTADTQPAPEAQVDTRRGDVSDHAREDFDSVIANPLDTVQQTIPAGWYTDPDELDIERYWDGHDWTDDTRTPVTAPSLFTDQRPSPVASASSSAPQTSPARSRNLTGVFFIAVILVVSGALAAFGAPKIGQFPGFHGFLNPQPGATSEPVNTSGSTSSSTPTSTTAPTTQPSSTPTTFPTSAATSAPTSSPVPSPTASPAVRPTAAATHTPGHDKPPTHVVGVPVPTRVSVISRDSALLISWGTSPGASVRRYDVQRSTSPSFAFTVASFSTTTTHFSDVNVAAGTAYWYRVRAVSAGKAGAWSRTVASFGAAPHGVSSLAVRVVQATGNLSWVAPVYSGNSPLRGYQIQRSTSADFSQAANFVVSGLTYTDQGLASGQTYWYRVRAVNRKGLTSAWTTEIQVSAGA